MRNPKIKKQLEQLVCEAIDELGSKKVLKWWENPRLSPRLREQQRIQAMDTPPDLRTPEQQDLMTQDMMSKGRGGSGQVAVYKKILEVMQPAYTWARRANGDRALIFIEKTKKLCQRLLPEDIFIKVRTELDKAEHYLHGKEAPAATNILAGLVEELEELTR